MSTLLVWAKDVNASNLARLCKLNAEDPVRYSHYPCISESGELLWPDGSPVPESLGLRADDQTTRLRRCGSSKAMKLINRGNRCETLLAKLGEFAQWERKTAKRSWRLLQPLSRMFGWKKEGCPGRTVARDLKAATHSSDLERFFPLEGAKTDRCHGRRAQGGAGSRSEEEGLLHRRAPKEQAARRTSHRGWGGGF